MKSTAYSQSSGLAQRPKTRADEDPDLVETILVERPFDEGTTRIREILRSRVVGPNAIIVYLEYQFAGNHGPERQSLRATARALNMPWTTFWRARRELEAQHILLAVRSGLGPARLIVRDIREVVQNEPVVRRVVQIEPIVVQNEPASLTYNTSAELSSSFPSEVLLMGHTKKKHEESSEDKSSSDVVAHNDDLDLAFGVGPSSLKVRTSERGKNFRLRPPRGPTDEPHSPRKRRPKNPMIRKGPERAPYYVYRAMYKLCYGIATKAQETALTKEMAGRVGSAIQRLQLAGADVTRIYEFGTWWHSWAKFKPTPEKVLEFWWRAIEEIDVPKRAVEELSRRAKEDAEKWTDERLREFAQRRARELGNPNA